MTGEAAFRDETPAVVEADEDRIGPTKLPKQHDDEPRLGARLRPAQAETADVEAARRLHGEHGKVVLAHVLPRARRDRKLVHDVLRGTFLRLAGELGEQPAGLDLATRAVEIALEVLEFEQFKRGFLDFRRRIADAATNPAAQAALARADVRQMWDEIAGLRDNWRQAVLMRYSGMGFLAVVEVMGCDPAVAEEMLSKGVRQVAEALPPAPVVAEPESDPAVRVTLLDVADAAGVSITTAWLAVNNRQVQGISETTRRRVRQIAQERGYPLDGAKVPRAEGVPERRTQVDLAEVTGMSADTINRALRGTAKPSTIRKLEEAARGIDYHWPKGAAGRKRVTLDDVARRADVSRAAAGRVVRGEQAPPGVTAAVMDAVFELGYEASVYIRRASSTTPVQPETPAQRAGSSARDAVAGRSATAVDDVSGKPVVPAHPSDGLANICGVVVQRVAKEILGPEAGAHIKPKRITRKVKDDGISETQFAEGFDTNLREEPFGVGVEGVEAVIEHSGMIAMAVDAWEGLGHAALRFEVDERFIQAHPELPDLWVGEVVVFDNAENELGTVVVIDRFEGRLMRGNERYAWARKVGARAGEVRGIIRRRNGEWVERLHGKPPRKRGKGEGLGKRLDTRHDLIKSLIDEAYDGTEAARRDSLIKVRYLSGLLERRGELQAHELTTVISTKGFDLVSQSVTQVHEQEVHAKVFREGRSADPSVPVADVFVAAVIDEEAEAYAENSEFAEGLRERGYLVADDENERIYIAARDHAVEVARREHPGLAEKHLKAIGREEGREALRRYLAEPEKDGSPSYYTAQNYMFWEGFRSPELGTLHTPTSQPVATELRRMALEQTAANRDRQILQRAVDKEIGRLGALPDDSGSRRDQRRRKHAALIMRDLVAWRCQVATNARALTRAYEDRASRDVVDAVLQRESGKRLSRRAVLVADDNGGSRLVVAWANSDEFRIIDEPAVKEVLSRPGLVIEYLHVTTDYEGRVRTTYREQPQPKPSVWPPEVSWLDLAEQASARRVRRVRGLLTKTEIGRWADRILTENGIDILLEVAHDRLYPAEGVLVLDVGATDAELMAAMVHGAVQVQQERNRPAGSSAVRDLMTRSQPNYVAMMQVQEWVAQAWSDESIRQLTGDRDVRDSSRQSGPSAVEFYRKAWDDAHGVPPSGLLGAAANPEWLDMVRRELRTAQVQRAQARAGLDRLSDAALARLGPASNDLELQRRSPDPQEVAEAERIDDYNRWNTRIHLLHSVIDAYANRSRANVELAAYLGMPLEYVSISLVTTLLGTTRRPVDDPQRPADAERVAALCTEFVDADTTIRAFRQQEITARQLDGTTETGATEGEMAADGRAAELEFARLVVAGALYLDDSTKAAVVAIIADLLRLDGARLGRPEVIGGTYCIPILDSDDTLAIIEVAGREDPSVTVQMNLSRHRQERVVFALQLLPQLTSGWRNGDLVCAAVGSHMTRLLSAADGRFTAMLDGAPRSRQLAVMARTSRGRDAMYFDEVETEPAVASRTPPLPPQASSAGGSAPQHPSAAAQPNAATARDRDLARLRNGLGAALNLDDTTWTRVVAVLEAALRRDGARLAPLEYLDNGRRIRVFDADGRPMVDIDVLGAGAVTVRTHLAQDRPTQAALAMTMLLRFLPDWNPKQVNRIFTTVSNRTAGVRVAADGTMTMELSDDQLDVSVQGTRGTRNRVKRHLALYFDKEAPAPPPPPPPSAGDGAAPKPPKPHGGGGGAAIVAPHDPIGFVEDGIRPPRKGQRRNVQQHVVLNAFGPGDMSAHAHGEPGRAGKFLRKLTGKPEFEPAQPESVVGLPEQLVVLRRDAVREVRELRVEVQNRLTGLSVDDVLDMGEAAEEVASEVARYRRWFAELLGGVSPDELIDDIRVEQEFADLQTRIPTSSDELILARGFFRPRHRLTQMIGELRGLLDWCATVDALEDRLYDAHSRDEQGAGSADDVRRLIEQAAGIADATRQLHDLRAQRVLPGRVRGARGGVIADAKRRFGYDLESKDQPRMGRRAVATLKELDEQTRLELAKSDLSRSEKRTLDKRAAECRVLLEWNEQVEQRDNRLRVLERELNDALDATGVRGFGSQVTLGGTLAQRAEDAVARREKLRAQLKKTGKEFDVDPANLNSNVLKGLARTAAYRGFWIKPKKFRELTPESVDSWMAGSVRVDVRNRAELGEAWKRVHKVIGQVTELIAVERRLRGVDELLAALRQAHARQAVAEKQFTDRRDAYLAKFAGDRFDLLTAPQDLSGLRQLHEQTEGEQQTLLGKLLEPGEQYQRLASDTNRLEERVQRFQYLLDEAERVRERCEQAENDLIRLGTKRSALLGDVRNNAELLQRVFDNFDPAQNQDTLALQLRPERMLELGITAPTELTVNRVHGLMSRLSPRERRWADQFLLDDSLYRAAVTIQTCTIELDRIDRVVNDGLAQSPAEFLNPGGGPAVAAHRSPDTMKPIRLRGSCAPYAVQTHQEANRRAQGEDPEELEMRPREFSMSGDKPVDVAIELRSHWVEYSSIDQPVGWVTTMHELEVHATVTVGIDYTLGRGAHLATITWDLERDEIVVYERGDGQKLVHRGGAKVQAWAVRQAMDAEGAFGIESENGEMTRPLAEGEQPTGPMPRQLLRGAPTQGLPPEDGPARRRPRWRRAVPEEESELAVRETLTVSGRGVVGRRFAVERANTWLRARLRAAGWPEDWIDNAVSSCAPIIFEALRRNSGTATLRATPGNVVEDEQTLLFEAHDSGSEPPPSGLPMVHSRPERTIAQHGWYPLEDGEPFAPGGMVWVKVGVPLHEIIAVLNEMAMLFQDVDQPTRDTVVAMAGTVLRADGTWLAAPEFVDEHGFFVQRLRVAHRSGTDLLIVTVDGDLDTRVTVEVPVRQGRPEWVGLALQVVPELMRDWTVAGQADAVLAEMFGRLAEQLTGVNGRIRAQLSGVAGERKLIVVLETIDDVRETMVFTEQRDGPSEDTLRSARMEGDPFEDVRNTISALADHAMTLDGATIEPVTDSRHTLCLRVVHQGRVAVRVDVSGAPYARRIRVTMAVPAGQPERVDLAHGLVGALLRNWGDRDQVEDAMGAAATLATLMPYRVGGDAALVAEVGGALDARRALVTMVVDPLVPLPNSEQLHGVATRGGAEPVRRVVEFQAPDGHWVLGEAVGFGYDPIDEIEPGGQALHDELDPLLTDNESREFEEAHLNQEGRTDEVTDESSEGEPRVHNVNPDPPDGPRHPLPQPGTEFVEPSGAGDVSNSGVEEALRSEIHPLRRGGDGAADPGRPLRVVTWNMAGAHRSRSHGAWDYEKVNLPYFAEQLRRMDADVIYLQESEVGPDGSTARQLAAMVGYRYVHETVMCESHMDPEKKKMLSIAVLSRLPIEEACSIELPLRLGSS